MPAPGQKKRPVSEGQGDVRSPLVIYCAYLVKKFNLKIRTLPFSESGWPKSNPQAVTPPDGIRLALARICQNLLTNRVGG
jgi:hypothetical protein